MTRKDESHAVEADDVEGDGHGFGRRLLDFIAPPAESVHAPTPTVAHAPATGLPLATTASAAPAQVTVSQQADPEVVAGLQKLYLDILRGSGNAAGAFVKTVTGLSRRNPDVNACIVMAYDVLAEDHTPASIVLDLANARKKLGTELGVAQQAYNARTGEIKQNITALDTRYSAEHTRITEELAELQRQQTALNEKLAALPGARAAEEQGLNADLQEADRGFSAVQSAMQSVTSVIDSATTAAQSRG